MAAALKNGGWFVLDFMNSKKKSKELICEEKINLHGITFGIQRFEENNFIIKEISVSDKEKNFLFREKVKAYTQKELENFFLQNSLEGLHLLGDYNLNPFDEKKSERLIFIGRKK